LTETPDAALSKDELPPPGAAWEAIAPFAYSFDGYGRLGSFDACAAIANPAFTAWTEQQVLPKSFLDLRTCLFFEQRRWRHFGDDPDEEALKYIHALLEAIREQVQ